MTAAPPRASSAPQPSSAALARASRRLTAWYRKHARDLPWRRTKDPYLIWVSEVMLQQTQVPTVIPYFERFVRAFPSIRALARATDEEVMSHWSGLGYYSRAKRLHQAAKILSQTERELPRSQQELKELPGIGAYISAAIASIAFSEVTAAMDGNVERTISRWLAVRGDPRRAAAKRRIRTAAQALLDGAEPGLSNQALMDIGAVICRPQKPRCGACPLRADCRARILGLQDRLPARRPRGPARQVRAIAALVRRDGATLLCRRAESANWMPGLWEIPWVPMRAREALSRAEEELRLTYGLRIRLGRPLAAVRHAITQNQFRVDLRLGTTGERLRGFVDAKPQRAWFSERSLAALPLTGLTKKLLRSAVSR
jgi:A/G-specific adenine glycosylase